MSNPLVRRGALGAVTATLVLAATAAAAGSASATTASPATHDRHSTTHTVGIYEYCSSYDQGYSGFGYGGNRGYRNNDCCDGFYGGGYYGNGDYYRHYGLLDGLLEGLL